MTTLIVEVFSDLEASKYQMAEYRISIYGRYVTQIIKLIRSMDEWDKLASWIVDNKLFSHNVRWLVQIPRLYNVYKSTNIVTTFNDLIKSRYPLHNNF
jgi:AMP deaminase